ncbi:acyl carrier protein [Pendulispora albinea]|uniref:Acyl carrier protein n=1 Tax=Pendulispora albinea TaxID=2741071 RepID=A0ABZ2M0F6_9BACT
MDVERIITSKFASAVNRSPEEIDPNANLIQYEGMNSILAVQLISQLESEFGIHIDQDEIRHIQTLNDIISLTKKKVGQPA